MSILIIHLSHTYNLFICIYLLFVSNLCFIYLFIRLFVILSFRYYVGPDHSYCIFPIRLQDERGEWVKAQEEIEIKSCRRHHHQSLVQLIKSLLWPWLYPLEPEPRGNSWQKRQKDTIDFNTTLSMSKTVLCSFTVCRSVMQSSCHNRNRSSSYPFNSNILLESITCHFIDQENSCSSVPGKITCSSIIFDWWTFMSIN